MSETLETGRELDALVAEKVFGVDITNARVDPMNRNGEPQYYWGYPVGHDFAPNYSTDISAAWQVIEKAKQWPDKAQRQFARALAKHLKIRDCEYGTVSTIELVVLGNGDAQGLSAEAICRAAVESATQEQQQ